MSQLLCYSNPKECAFVGDFMTELLGVTRAQLTRAIGFARERYSSIRPESVSKETWRYLGLAEIFREVRSALGVKSFLGVQNVMWNAWENEDSLASKTNHGAGWKQLGPPEALERGRQGELQVIRWEKRQGRSPKDVAERNLGYDIESMDKAGRPRYIEVKNYGGRPVELTSHEYQEAKRIAEDYYLYVVHLDRDHGRSIRIIRNPVESCRLAEKPTVQYIVANWMSKGDSVRY